MDVRALWLGPAVVVLCIGTAAAGSHHDGHGGGGGIGIWPHHGHIVSPGLLGVGTGFGAYVAPAIVVAPGGLPPIFGPVATAVPPPLVFDRGDLLAGPMPIDPSRGLRIPPPGVRAKRADPVRATQLITLGDRLFRAGNTRKAEERFEQALRSDPNSAVPHVRLAQLALVRAQYSEGANQLRAAQTAEPGWLIRAPDVQALFAEPADFARHIAKLESHLQANPNDRDAWLVLGAEWFLSGRTRKAADVFLRLSDRQPDAALAAFLDAATPRAAEREQ
ncbi:MAG: tetratricopeptide repeat protein [Isosphaeraceae bacterium]|nr:tetratricopeptide repeat protein [Isosphaeraceae bacterium]